LEKTLPGELLPSTIVTDELKSGIVRVNHSSNPLFNTENKSTQTTYSLSDLLRQQLDASLPLQEIIQASQQGHLTIGSDGSYPSKINKATYSWSFSNKSLICSGSGVIRAANTNPYRAELMGILTSLIVLQKAEESYPIKSGRATIISDSQSALQNTFKTGPIGVKSARQDGYDILLDILNLRRTLRTSVTPAWIESTKTMTHLTEEQQINAEAHELAIKWLRDDDQTNTIDLTNILENQTVSVLSNGKIITSGLPQQITTNIHYEPLKEKFKKKNSLTQYSIW
jgi:hypothetical protein